MPHFFNSAGDQVSASEALIDGQQLRNGYRQTMAPGDRMSFDIFAMDAARGKGSVYILDGGKDWAKEVRDAARDGRFHLTDRQSLSGTETLSGTGSTGIGDPALRAIRAARYA